MSQCIGYVTIIRTIKYYNISLKIKRLFVSLNRRYSIGQKINWHFFFLFLHNFRSTNLFIFYPLIFLLYSFIKMSRSIREMIFLLPFLHQEETHSFSSAVTRTLVSRATTRAKLHRSFFTRINLEKIPSSRGISRKLN